MQVTLTGHAEELLRTALVRHPGQSPADILEQALAERVQRETAGTPAKPKRTREEFRVWLDRFTAYSGKIPSMPGESGRITISPGVLGQVVEPIDQCLQRRVDGCALLAEGSEVMSLTERLVMESQERFESFFGGLLAMEQSVFAPSPAEPSAATLLYCEARQDQPA